jgi:hypothetical protein
MGTAWGTCFGEDTASYDTKVVPKKGKVPTITYNGIRQIKLKYLDWGDLRTSVRNSIGDKVDEHCDLEFDLRHKDNIALISQLSEYVLPPFKAIKIVKPSMDSTKANKFLLFSFPPSVDLLILDSFDDDHTTPLYNFFNPLWKVSGYVKKELWLGRYIMSSTQFIKILENYRHCEQITFHNCRITDLESNWDLRKDLEYSIKCLSLESWKESITNDSFACFIESVSNTSLKDSIEEVNIYNCDADVDVVLDQLNGLHMDILVEDTNISMNLITRTNEKIFY